MSEECENWIDLMVIGSSFEIQMDVNSVEMKVRHRPFPYDGTACDWVDGYPKGMDATNV